MHHIIKTTIFFLLICVLNTYSSLAQNNFLALKNGKQIPINTSINLKKTAEQNIIILADTAINLEQINYYCLDSNYYYNVRDKFFAQLQSKGAINIFNKNGSKFFNVGDTSKIEKLNYTNLYYAIQNDEECIKLLKKGDLTQMHTKQVFIASAFAIANGVFAITTSNQFSFSTNKVPVFKIIYLIGSGFVGGLSVPAFFASGLMGLTNSPKIKLLRVVKEYNRKH